MLRFTNTADITSHDANILIVQTNICFFRNQEYWEMGRDIQI